MRTNTGSRSPEGLTIRNSNHFPHVQHFRMHAPFIVLPRCPSWTCGFGVQLSVISAAACGEPPARYKSPSSKRQDSARIAAWLSSKMAVPRVMLGLTTLVPTRSSATLRIGLLLSLSTAVSPPGFGPWHPRPGAVSEAPLEVDPRTGLTEKRQNAAATGQHSS